MIYLLTSKGQPLSKTTEAKEVKNDTTLDTTSLPVILRSWAYKSFISLAAATIIALHYAYPRTIGTYSPTTDAQTPATLATSSPVLLPAIPDLCTSST